jgi:hypothetical protein
MALLQEGKIYLGSSVIRKHFIAAVSALVVVAQIAGAGTLLPRRRSMILLSEAALNLGVT